MQQPVIKEGALARAIELASQEEIPLAVVFCLHKDEYEVLDQLEPIERSLPAIVPLMVMVGEMPARLAALRYHTQPAMVIFDDAPSTEVLLTLEGVEYEVVMANKRSPDVTRLPSWPGRIIKIAELRAIIASGEFC